MDTKSPYLHWYFKLFNYVAAKRLQKGDLPPSTIHTLTIIVLATSSLMWAYALLAQFTISSKELVYLCYVCSFIHSSTPLWLRITNSTVPVTHLMMSSGFIQITAYSYYTGGFMSFCIIWLAILPMVAGIITGRLGMLFWTGLSLLNTIIFLGLHVSGYHFPEVITLTGLLWLRAFTVFGWIIVSALCIFVFILLKEQALTRLSDQAEKIEDLFRVLYHDLVNPLERIGIGNYIAKKGISSPETDKGLNIIKEATDSMMEITRNVSKMYAAWSGKTHIDLTLVSLNEMVEKLEKFMSQELQNKQLRLEYDYDYHKDLKVLVEEVSFKHQVLGNILNNAIKFSSPGGKITIQARAIEDGKILVKIKDEGVGIPGVLLKDLFEVNKKTNRPGTHGEKGTGFGMLIIKSFIELYDGRIEVESSESGKDRGTLVKLILNGEWKK